MRPTASLLTAALLTAGCASQTVIAPPAPDSAPTQVDVTGEQGSAHFAQGYAYHQDRLQDVVYRVDANQLEDTFGPTLDPMRKILAAGLPELPHSYAALLASPRGPLGTLSVQARDNAPMVLDQTSQGVFIDGYPDRPHAVDKQRIDHDFGPALASLAATLKSMGSYLILLDSPDGAASKVVFRTRGGETYLDHTGQSLTLDGIDNEADKQIAEKDFHAVKASTQQILDEGLPKLPHSYVALVENPAGPLGEVEILEGKAQGVILDQAGQAVIIDGLSNKIYALEQAQYDKDFGDSMQAMPPPPVTYILYFKSGSAHLTRDSQAIMPLILDEIRKRPAADITIAGYTDTVGGKAINQQLSHKRSAAITDQIRKNRAPILEISQDAYGKTMLAVQTPDNTPELLNRRVEVSIR